MTEQDEDRILRIWTPIILRVSVLASAVLLLFGLVEMAVFVAVLLVGYVYIWRKGGFEWQ